MRSTYRRRHREPHKGSRKPRNWRRRHKFRLYARHSAELSVVHRAQRGKAYQVLAMMRAGNSFTFSCAQARIDPRTVRKHISIALYKRKNRVRPRRSDHFFRSVRNPSPSKDLYIELSDSREASRLALYFGAVRDFLQNGDAIKLNSYRNQGVVDSGGVFRPFLVNPKVLIMMHERIEEPEFYSIYESL